jgi:hypothetical protein
MHICCCIVFDCFDSNLCLNSFVCFFRKNRKTFFLFFLVSAQPPSKVRPSPLFSTGPPLFLPPRRNPAPLPAQSGPPARRHPAEADGRAPPIIPFPVPRSNRSRARPWARAARACGLGPARQAAFSGLFKGCCTPDRAAFRKTLARAPVPPPPDPRARPPSSVFRSAASPPTRSTPGASQGSRDHAFVVCSHPHALLRPCALVGVGTDAAVHIAGLHTVAVARPSILVP